ncbi:MAG: hypothetical protein ACREQT_02825 [Candidatus Binataceae bacterium]
MLRLAAKKDVRSGVASKLHDDFSKTILALQPGERAALVRAFEVVRGYGHETTRLSGTEHSALVGDLLAVGLPAAAEAVFATCVDSIAGVPAELLINTMPSPSCIDLWLKRSKAPKQILLDSVSASRERYYGTAWFDWFLRRASVKALWPFASLALESKKRPAYLPDALELLALILTRDRKLAFAEALLKTIVQDPARIKVLVLACSHADRAGESYARALGLVLANESSAGGAQLVASALQEIMRSRDEADSRFAAQFAAHVATTWRLAVGVRRAPDGVVEDELLRVGTNILLSSQGGDKRDFWLVSTTRTITDQLLSRKGSVSPQGALEIALALRAAQMESNAFDALWSAAFNLGIREVGKPDVVEPFDPMLHEDIKGGLLRGDDARVIRCGWRLADTVLLREQVEPARPGGNSDENTND